jgi:hypothetical protein
LVYTFLREKLSTALMGKKKQTLSILGKSLRYFLLGLFNSPRFICVKVWRYVIW